MITMLLLPPPLIIIIIILIHLAAGDEVVVHSWTVQYSLHHTQLLEKSNGSAHMHITPTTHRISAVHGALMLDP